VLQNNKKIPARINGIFKTCPMFSCRRSSNAFHFKELVYKPQYPEYNQENTNYKPIAEAGSAGFSEVEQYAERGDAIKCLV
jgi:hypothetical protein